jgi:hypothetical protein
MAAERDTNVPHTTHPASHNQHSVRRKREVARALSVKRVKHRTRDGISNISAFVCVTEMVDRELLTDASNSEQTQAVVTAAERGEQLLVVVKSAEASDVHPRRAVVGSGPQWSASTVRDQQLSTV